MNLQGCFTAIITPFSNGDVDEVRMRQLIEEQIAGGVDGIVPLGTTGESPTFSFNEHHELIRKVVKIVDGRCKVIAGTGANSTSEAIEMTREAAKAGADVSLQVTPYYNKPTQEGLYRHFSTVAEEGGLPIVLYNVPGRSGQEIAIDTVKRLAELPNVVAIKEAAGSVDRVSAILNCCELSVLSGDDSLTLPMMSVGAKGVISVASNVIPAEMTALTHAALAGEWDKARELHYKYYDLFNAMFIETNPIPVKAAMVELGKVEEEYRLPLCPMSEANRAKLVEVMKRTGLL